MAEGYARACYGYRWERLRYWWRLWRFMWKESWRGAVGRRMNTPTGAGTLRGGRWGGRGGVVRARAAAGGRVKWKLIDG